MTIGVCASAVPFGKGRKIKNIWFFFMIAFGYLAILKLVYIILVQYYANQAQHPNIMVLTVPDAAEMNAG